MDSGWGHFLPLQGSLQPPSEPPSDPSIVLLSVGTSDGPQMRAPSPGSPGRHSPTALGQAREWLLITSPDVFLADPLEARKGSTRRCPEAPSPGAWDSLYVKLFVKWMSF